MVRLTPADLVHEVVDTGSLRPHPQNPRTGALQQLAESVGHHGVYRSLVVSQDGFILAGNHTYAAALERGVDHVWVGRLPLKHDDPQAIRIMLEDNRAGDLGTYDEGLLAELLQSLPDLSGTGYGQEDLDSLLGFTPKEGLTDPDDVPELPKEAVTRSGDLWLLGEHRLLCGDATRAEDYERLMDGRKANVIVTSPPYASQRAYDGASGFVPVRPDAYGDWFGRVAEQLAVTLAPDGSLLLNIKEHADEGQRHLYVKKLLVQLVEHGHWLWVDEFAWVKAGVPGAWPNRFKNAWEPVFHLARGESIKFRPDGVSAESDHVFDYSPENGKSVSGSGLLGSEHGARFHTGRARPGNVLTIGTGGGQVTGDHPAQFPVALPAWFMRAFSDEGDLVLDPFMGSGSVLIAALETGRISGGLEISPLYCDVICRRFQEFTGTLPILESTGQEHDFTDRG